MLSIKRAKAVCEQLEWWFGVLQPQERLPWREALGKLSEHSEITIRMPSGKEIAWITWQEEDQLFRLFVCVTGSVVWAETPRVVALTVAHEAIREILWRPEQEGRWEILDAAVGTLHYDGDEFACVNLLGASRLLRQAKKIVAEDSGLTISLVDEDEAEVNHALGLPLPPRVYLPALKFQGAAIEEQLLDDYAAAVAKVLLTTP